MKKSQVARGIIGSVASLLGVVAVGCSADVMDEGVAGNGEIGSVAQAITVQSLSGGTALAEGFSRAGQCVIRDTQNGGRDLLVAAGGLEDSGTTDRIRYFDPAAGWTALPNSGGSAVKLTAALLDLQGIQHPTDNTKCFFVGGATSIDSAAVDTVHVLSLTAGTFAVTTATDMNLETSNFALSFCKDDNGNKRMVVFGGQDSGTKLDQIQIANAVVPTGWNTISTGMIDARKDFAFAKEPVDSENNNHYVVGGGLGSGGQLREIELITLNDECDELQVARLSDINGADLLSTAVEGNIGFFDSALVVEEETAGAFVFAAGYNAVGLGSLPEDVDHLQVTAWGASPTYVYDNAADALDSGKGMYRPALVEVSSTQHVLIGGATAPNGASPTSLAFANEFLSGAFSESEALNESRFTPAAALIGSTIYAGSGQLTYGTPPTFRTSTEVIAP